MAYPNPPVGRLHYELWIQGGAKVGDLPVTACWYRVDDRIDIDGTEYQVQGIRHYLEAEEDWPGPAPPAYDRGFGDSVIHVYVTEV